MRRAGKAFSDSPPSRMLDMPYSYMKAYIIPPYSATKETAANEVFTLLCGDAIPSHSPRARMHAKSRITRTLIHIRDQDIQPGRGFAPELSRFAIEREKKRLPRPQIRYPLRGRDAESPATIGDEKGRDRVKDDGV